MTEEQKQPDVLDMLVEALVLRIEAKLMERIDQRIADQQPTIHAENVEDLEQVIDRCLEEHTRNFHIDADNVEGLEAYIKDCLKDATVDISF